MKVIDASALAAFVLKEPCWREIATHLAEGVASINHVFKEVANAIWRRRRSGDISVEEAYAMIEALKKLVDAVEVVDEMRYLWTAFEIALKHNLTIYDSLYIAVAQESHKPLITLDEKQRRVAEELSIPTICPSTT